MGVKGGKIKYDLDADVGARLCQSAWIDASSWLVLEAFATFTAIKCAMQNWGEWQYRQVVSQYDVRLQTLSM